MADVYLISKEIIKSISKIIKIQSFQKKIQTIFMAQGCAKGFLDKTQKAVTTLKNKVNGITLKFKTSHQRQLKKMKGQALTPI